MVAERDRGAVAGAAGRAGIGTAGRSAGAFAGLAAGGRSQGRLAAAAFRATDRIPSATSRAGLIARTDSCAGPPVRRDRRDQRPVAARWLAGRPEWSAALPTAKLFEAVGG